MTRWNTFMDLIKIKIFNWFKTITLRTNDNVAVPDMVATSQLNILRDLVKLLSPFKVATEKLNTEKLYTIWLYY